MRNPIICLFGILFLAACGTPDKPLQQAGASTETIQVIAAQVETTPAAASQILPLPTPTIETISSANTPISPLPTPIVEMTPPATTPVSPLPTPAVPKATSVSSTETLPASQTAQLPGKLTGRMGEAAIIYQRSGGFAGVSEQWAIYPDGRITAGNGREWQITRERVGQLLADIEALGFFELSDSYMPLNTCCDRFTYSIVVCYGHKANQVTTIDAAPNAPPELQKTLEKINNLLSDLQ